MNPGDFVFFGGIQYYLIIGNDNNESFTLLDPFTTLRFSHVSITGNHGAKIITSIFREEFE